MRGATRRDKRRAARAYRIRRPVGGRLGPPVELTPRRGQAGDEIHPVAAAQPLEGPGSGNPGVALEPAAAEATVPPRQPGSDQRAAPLAVQLARPNHVRGDVAERPGEARRVRQLLEPGHLAPGPMIGVQQATACPEHPPDLAQERGVVAIDVGRLDVDHEIEAAIGKRQPQRMAAHEGDHRAGPRSAPGRTGSRASSCRARSPASARAGAAPGDGAPRRGRS